MLELLMIRVCIPCIMVGSIDQQNMNIWTRSPRPTKARIYNTFSFWTFGSLRSWVPLIVSKHLATTPSDHPPIVLFNQSTVPELKTTERSTPKPTKGSKKKWAQQSKGRAIAKRPFARMSTPAVTDGNKIYPVKGMRFSFHIPGIQCLLDFNLAARHSRSPRDRLRSFDLLCFSCSYWHQPVVWQWS